MDTKRRLIGNSVFLFIDWIGITLLSFIFWIIIGKMLPKESYGIVATSLNIITILSGFSLLGLQTTVIKLISEYKDQNDEAKIRGLIRFSLKVVIVVNVVISAVLGLLSGYLSPILNLPVEAIIMVAVSIFVFSVWGLTTSIIYGLQAMKRAMLSDVIGNVVKVGITAGLTFIGFNYFGPLIGLVVSVGTIVLFRLDVLLLSRNVPKGTKLNSKSIFNYSAAALAITIATVGFANTPNIILNALTSPGVTALFAISLTITSPILTIPAVLNSALFPITSGLSTQRGGRSRQKILIDMVMRYSSFVTLPIIAILVVFSHQIILLFSRADFLSATQFLPMVGIAAFLFAIASIFNNSIYAIRKPGISGKITIATLGVFLPLSIPLSYYFGAMGMAASYLASISFFFALNFFYLRKFIRISFDLPSIGKILLSVAIFSALIFGVNTIFSSNILKVAGLAAASVVYVVILVPMRFYRQEDLKIIDFVSDRVRNQSLRTILFHLRSLISKYSH